MIERSKLSWENSILTHIFQNFHCQKKKKLTRKWRYIALFLVDKKLDPWGKLPIFLTPWTVLDTALTSLTRQQCKKKEQEKKKGNHRFWQMDLPIPLILWYTLKQQVWEVLKPTYTHPPSLWPLLCPLLPLPSVPHRS